MVGRSLDNMKKRLVPDFELAFESPKETLGFSIWNTTNLWQRKIKEKLDPLGITHVQFLLLNSLASLNKDADRSITQRMVAQQSGCDKMMVSKVLRTLEDKKLLQRKDHASDTRSKSLLITTKGMELLKEATPLFLQAESAFFDSLGKKEKPFHKRIRKINKINNKEEVSEEDDLDSNDD
jgi:DNA-binding MarR family transcriptional regulator